MLVGVSPREEGRCVLSFLFLWFLGHVLCTGSEVRWHVWAPSRSGGLGLDPQTSDM